MSQRVGPGCPKGSVPVGRVGPFGTEGVGSSWRGRFLLAHLGQKGSVPFVPPFAPLWRLVEILALYASFLLQKVAQQATKWYHLAKLTYYSDYTIKFGAAMRRKVDKQLDDWVNANTSRPLLVRGSRRVGKTYAIKRLGQDKFGSGYFAYCDFQTNLDQLTQIFSATTDIERIVSDLSLFLHQDIIPGKTLIAFDEIQLCEKALNSLRFFSGSKYHVVATGSQLGVTLRNRTLPYPSDIDQLDLHPMDFEEFLWAIGEELLADGIRSAVHDRRQFLLHEEAMGLYRQYIVVGGMPQVVLSHVEDRDYTMVRTQQAEVDRTYIADIAMYAPNDSVVHTLAVWDSIPKQLARQTTRKFKYTEVASGGRERRYRAPLAWLEAADLVSLNYQTNETAPPLTARDDGAFFKVYLADTGLMFYKFNLGAEAYLDESLRQALSARFRGALAENYIMQALTANSLQPFYWMQGSTSQYEVEFVLQTRHGGLVPIEVKSGRNVSSASLRNFVDKSKAPYAIRFSSKNIGYEGGILSLPLYAAYCVDEQSLIMVG